jgi:hypothetical protein
MSELIEIRYLGRGGQCVWDSACFLGSVLEQPAYYQEATDRCQVRSLLGKLPLA